MAKILFIDEKAGFRRNLTKTLQASGYEVEEHAEVNEAGVETAAESADLLLIDLGRPDIANNVSWVLGLKPRRHKKIVLLTTSGLQDFAEAAKLSVYRYLEKPFRVEDLLTLICSELSS